MKLRRRYMNDVKGSPQHQKALAMAIFIKRRIDRRDSTIYNYTPNKVKMLTGIAAKTFLRYLPIMVEEGYVSFCGKDNEHLVVKRLSSHTDCRNIDISDFCFDSFSEVYRSLRSYIFLLLQAKKDYVRRILQSAKNPSRNEDYMAIRKKVKGLVKRGILNSAQQEYKEFGLSFRRIAKEVGNCIRTAENIVNYAIKHLWVKKKKNFEQVFTPKINFYQVEGYTFSTRNNLYLIHANSYTLSPQAATNLAG